MKRKNLNQQSDPDAVYWRWVIILAITAFWIEVVYQVFVK